MLGANERSCGSHQRFRSTAIFRNGGLDMEELWNQVTQVVGPYVPRLIAAVALLVVGWLVAMLIAGIVRGLLRQY